MFRHEVIITDKNLPFRVVIHKQSVVQITKHWHESIEINYTLHGEGDYIVSGVKTHLSDNEFIIINSGNVHGVENIGNGDTRRSLTLLIPYATILKLAPNFDEFEFVSSVEDVSKMQAVIRYLKAIYTIWADNTNEFKEIKVKGYFYLLMAKLLEDFTIPKKKVLAFNNVKKTDKVKEIIGYLMKHYQEPLTLDDISEEFNLSKTYIDRLFKKEVGTSLYRYIQLVRLKFACQQIADSNQSIELIADLCGFSNVKSLRNLFKQVYGMSPIKYRKKIRG